MTSPSGREPERDLDAWLRAHFLPPADVRARAAAAVAGARRRLAPRRARAPWPLALAAGLLVAGLGAVFALGPAAEPLPFAAIREQAIAAFANSATGCKIGAFGQRLGDACGAPIAIDVPREWRLEGPFALAALPQAQAFVGVRERTQHVLLLLPRQGDRTPTTNAPEGMAIARRELGPVAAYELMPAGAQPVLLPQLR
jgi:hypothetical protein